MCTDFFLLGKLQLNKTIPKPKRGNTHAHLPVEKAEDTCRHPASPQRQLSPGRKQQFQGCSQAPQPQCQPRMAVAPSSSCPSPLKSSQAVTSLLEMPRSLGANSCLLERSGHPWAVDPPGSPILTARSDTGGERNALGVASEQAHPTHIYHTACLGWSQTLTLFCE